MNDSQKGTVVLPKTGQRFRQILWLIIIAYCGLGLLYSWATPPFESSDEYKHYPVVHHIQNEGQLVTLDPDNPGRWLQEGAQPPLYYVIMAVLTWPIDTSDLAEVHQVNKHVFTGQPRQINNKNLLFHTPENERFPARGSIQAVYIIRLASIALGVGTVIAAANLGVLLYDERIGLLAAALTAFNPMFLFTSAAVNNDSLANLLGAWGIYLLVLIWQRASRQQPIRKLCLLLGLILGLGMLTKLSIGGLLGLAGLAFAWLAMQQKRWRLLFVDGLLVAVIAFLLVAPLFGRNFATYGDITALNVFIEVQGSRAAEGESIGLQDWVEETGTLYRSFWGLFGGVNVGSPEPFYWIANLLAVAGLVGWLTRPRTQEKTGGWLVSAWAIVVFILLIRWNIISPAFQGRLLFPALTALNVIFAVGFLRWLPNKIIPSRILIAFFGGMALLIPLLSIKPAYAQPTPIAAVPTEATFGPFTYATPAGEIALVGVSVDPDQRVSAGDRRPIRLTLFWQAQTDISDNYIAAVNLLGRNFDVVGRVNRHPAGGMVPTSLWQAGDIWQDEFAVFVNDSAESPTLVRMKVDLFDTNDTPEGDDDVVFVAKGPDGNPADILIVGEAVLSGDDAKLVTEFRPNVQFEDDIKLLAYTTPLYPSRGATIPIEVLWEATGEPQTAYTVFVQLLDDSGNLISSGDSPPLRSPTAGSDFPTNRWQEGDKIKDVYFLNIPAEIDPGTYNIILGLYDPISGQRNSLTRGSNTYIGWSIITE